ncbi:MAG: S9 family peptidase [Acidobacteria bacterium]|nr:S9 family peptidase [Acidobacteriota bacterium]
MTACLALAVAAFPANPATADEALAEAVARMAKIGSCGSPSFAPDGKTLAIVADLTGVPQVWTVPVSGGWPFQVTALNDPVGAVHWSPDGEWLAFSVAPGGGMNQQVYVARPDGTDLKRITDGGRENNWLGDWTPDGTRLALASNRRDPAAMDAWLADPVSGQLTPVCRNPGIGRLADISPDGSRALVYRMVSRGDSNLYLVNLADGGEQLLTPHDGPGSFTGLFGADARTIYLSSNQDRDLSAFARVSLDEQGRPGDITHLAGRDDAELADFKINHQGTQAVLIWNVAGRNELALYDLKTGKLTTGPEPPAEIVGSPEFSPAGDRLVLAASGAVAPADIWVLDLAARQFHQVTHSPHPGVDLTRLVRPKLVRFPAHDGLELSGWLYLPPGHAAPASMVLSFHGGPEGQERPSFKSTYQALLARGIAVFAPNVRGSSGFGKRFVNLDNGARRVDGVRDITSCVDFVVKNKLAHPKRIGIMGGSYGGYMVMAGLTEFPALFAAGANLFGVVNFETFFAQTEPWMARISTVEYGDPATETDMLRRLSPIHNINRVVAPTIVLHGANDTNVPVVEAEQVVESLKKRSVPVKYVLFPDEGHGFRKLPNRITATVEIVRWFERYLQEPAP